MTKPGKDRVEEELKRAARLESVGTLAGGIAHDFNNLLTGILGNISLARRNLESGEVAQAINRLGEAEKASLRARDLTQQLLTFARGGTPIKKAISISRVITEAATFALRGSKTRPVFSVKDALWTVKADEGQISQVITNMAINADEAMPSGGILNISARNKVLPDAGALPLRGGNYVEIRIKDHGIGIDRKHFDAIFDPYFTTKQRGSGLGLATAYAIVKNHGGHITLKSQPGAGTTFLVYLPAPRNASPGRQRTRRRSRPCSAKAAYW